MIDPKKPYRTRSGHGDIKLFDVLDGRVYGAHRSAADLGWSAETWDVVTGRFDIAGRASGLDLVETIPPAPMVGLAIVAAVLDVAHAALRGIDAADQSGVIPGEELDAVSDAITLVETFARENGIRLWEFDRSDPAQHEAARQYRDKPACVDRAED